MPRGHRKIDGKGSNESRSFSEKNKTNQKNKESDKLQRTEEKERVWCGGGDKDKDIKQEINFIEENNHFHYHPPRISSRKPEEKHLQSREVRRQKKSVVR